MTGGEVSGPRRVVVEAERLAGFLDRLAQRHGELVSVVDADGRAVEITAYDGTVVACRVPFPPLRGTVEAEFAGMVEHVLRDRVVGLMLIRRGGFGAGVFEGRRLVASKVGSRHVQGRSAAGGWSQQRFARRREGQARVALDAAADAVAAVLVPAVGTLDAVVVGGDRQSCDRVLADPRLASLRPLLLEDRLDVPDPRQRVLEGAPALFRAVSVTITDSPTGLTFPSGP